MKKLFAMLLALCMMCGVVSAVAEVGDVAEKPLVVGDLEFGYFSFGDVDWYAYEKVAGEGDFYHEKAVLAIENKDSIGLSFVLYEYDSSITQWGDLDQYDYEDVCIAFLETYSLTIPTSSALSVQIGDNEWIDFSGSERYSDVTMHDGHPGSVEKGYVLAVIGYMPLSGGMNGLGFFYKGASYTVLYGNLPQDTDINQIAEMIAQKIRPSDLTEEDKVAGVTYLNNLSLTDLEEDDKLLRGVLDADGNYHDIGNNQPKEESSNQQNAAAGQNVVITGNGVNIRQDATTDAPVLAKGNKGDTFPYLGESGNWYKIDVNGQTGYVSMGLAEIK